MSGIYEVFQRKGATEAIMHVGSVNAADTRMALILAKECFFRREHPSAIWVARREDLHPLLEADVLGPGTDKTYRAMEAYAGIAKKRQDVEGRRP
jgi:ring-1,2-phenylacetyl-CoA epoxidase subunit PaaB